MTTGIRETASLPRRGLRRADAAKYCGLTASGFQSWISRGLLPGPIPGTHRWDRKAIDKALDKMSGLEPDAVETPLQRWRRERGCASI
jgi:hypothetical protein